MEVEMDIALFSVPSVGGYGRGILVVVPKERFDAVFATAQTLVEFVDEHIEKDKPIEGFGNVGKGDAAYRYFKSQIEPMGCSVFSEGELPETNETYIYAPPNTIDRL